MKLYISDMYTSLLLSPMKKIENYFSCLKELSD